MTTVRYAVIPALTDVRTGAFRGFLGVDSVEYLVQGIYDPNFMQAPLTTNADLGSTLDPTKGAAMVGYLRSNLTSAITTVSQMLSAQAVNLWEFANLVTSKPTPGDPSTWDWTPALAALLAHSNPNKCIPVTPAVSTYLSGALTITSGTNLVMWGATVHALSSLATGTPLLINATTGGAVDTYPDQNIQIFGGTFLGNAGARTNSLLAFINVKGCRLFGTRISGNAYQGVAFGGCRDVLLRDVELDHNGNPVVTAEGGPAVWLGAYAGSNTYDVVLDNVSAHDNNWSVLYGGATNVTIINPKWYQNKESSSFFNTTASGITFIGGYIKNIRRQNISASGIEFGGQGLKVFGTLIEDGDGNAISLTDANNVMVDGLQSHNMRRDAASFPTASHIDVIALSALGSQPQNITITNHTAYDDTAPAQAAVSLVGQGSAAAPANVVVKDGNYQATAWTSGQAVYVQETAPNMRSLTQSIRTNLGDPDINDFGGYAASRYYCGEGVGAASASSLALAANTLYCIPGVWRKSSTWTKIAVSVNVAAAAGKLLRLGIYRMNNGVPTSLYLDAGTIAADVTGLREITISKILPPGMFCLCVVSDGTPTLVAGSPGTQIQGTIGASAFGTADQLIIRSFTFATLPSLFGSVTYTTGPWPIVALKQ